MAKALLVGKTYLFRHQLNLEPDICHALRRISTFISLIYVKYWNRATSAVDAPLNDLLFMKELHLYKPYDSEIAQTAINSFRDHLWYLGSELITLSLFSSNVTSVTKNNMRRRLKANVSDRDELSLKFQIDENAMPFNELHLEDFVQPRSYFLFHLLEITPDFLLQDASTWEYSPSYNVIKNMIDQIIIVVNDGAERILGMAGMSIKTQKARKENNFKDLLFAKFDRNSRS